jgi:tRNA(fMet)-specific endonuclease VapC
MARFCGQTQAVKYLLDSNIIIAAIDGSNLVLHDRLAMCDEEDIVTSAIAFAEVAHGSNHGKPPPLEMLVEFLQDVPVLPFNEAAGRAYASLSFIRASYDRLIAAHALSLKLTVVTQNARHFADVPGLEVENWTE